MSFFTNWRKLNSSPQLRAVYLVANEVVQMPLSGPVNSCEFVFEFVIHFSGIPTVSSSQAYIRLLEGVSTKITI